MKHKPRNRIKPGDAGRCGFTLIELLLVIAIVTVLSTMALGVLRSATTDAKISATQARLTQINAIMEVVMEDYSVRRMPVDLNAALSPPVTRRMLREARYQILSELLDVELPRPLFDNALESYIPISNRRISPHFIGPGYIEEFDGRPNGFGTATNTFDTIGNYRAGSFLASTNAPYSALMQRWQLLAQQNPNDLNLPGEYLYQFLYAYDFDGAPAVEALGAQAIADTDGDQLMEVVDAFGEPLLFEIQQRAPENQNTDGDTQGMDVEDPDDDYPDPSNPLYLPSPDSIDPDDDGDGIPDARDENGTYDPLLRDGVQVINNIRIIVFSSRDTQDFN